MEAFVRTDSTVESSHASHNKDGNIVQYKRTLDGIIKPCSVILKILDYKTINSLCNTGITAARAETNNNISQIGTSKIGASFSKDLSTSPRKVDKILKSISEKNEQTQNIKQCYIPINKLPMCECLKNMHPNLVSSFHIEGASYSVEKVEAENCIPKEEYVTGSGISYFSSHLTLSSTESDQVSERESGNQSNHTNLICDSDYKCVFCNKSITRDDELYHHLCWGKRKKGYNCVFCEIVFETIPLLIQDVNFHFEYIPPSSLKKMGLKTM